MLIVFTVGSQFLREFDDAAVPRIGEQIVLHDLWKATDVSWEVSNETPPVRITLEQQMTVTKNAMRGN